MPLSWRRSALSVMGSGSYLPGFALWVLVPLLIVMRRFTWCRFAAAAILIAHYLGVLFVTLGRQGGSYVGQV